MKGYINSRYLNPLLLLFDTPPTRVNAVSFTRSELKDYDEDDNSDDNNEI